MTLAGVPLQQQAYPFTYPYMWNVPQWAPTTSMALFMPGLQAAPLQYAGQQRPDEPMVAGSQVRHRPALATLISGCCRAAYTEHAREELLAAHIPVRWFMWTPQGFC